MSRSVLPGHRRLPCRDRRNKMLTLTMDYDIFMTVVASDRAPPTDLQGWPGTVTTTTRGHHGTSEPIAIGPKKTDAASSTCHNDLLSPVQFEETASEWSKN